MISLLTRIPFLFWVVIGVSIWGGYGHLRYTRLQSEWDEYKLAQAEIAVVAQRAIRVAEANKIVALQNVQNEYYSKLKKVRSTVSVLKSSNDSLQNALSTAASNRTSEDPTAICGVNGERGRVLENLLGESAELVREGSERIAELSAKTTSLQNYIEQVCVSKENAAN